MNNDVICKPIGIIHSGHINPHKTPIQPIFANGCTGQAEIFRTYEKGLQDIEGFSHILILYHFHKTTTQKLMVKPFLENTERGVFATCAPSRPNHIGLSIVRLVKKEKNMLFLDDVDILDGTPIIDIKPYIARFFRYSNVRSGWQEKIDDQTAHNLGRRIQITERGF